MDVESNKVVYTSEGKGGYNNSKHLIMKIPTKKLPTPHSEKTFKIEFTTTPDTHEQKGKVSREFSILMPVMGKK
jgi:hypothetical protein